MFTIDCIIAALKYIEYRVERFEKKKYLNIIFLRKLCVVCFFLNSHQTLIIVFNSVVMK